jgi:hypothetical protein
MEDDDWEKTQAKYKMQSTKLLNSGEFLGMVHASSAAKAPLVYFMSWGQKAVGKYNTEVKKSKAEGVAYLGTGPASL